jgi:hypothetical protein
MCGARYAMRWSTIIKVIVKQRPMAGSIRVIDSPANMKVSTAVLYKIAQLFEVSCMEWA